MIQYLVVALAKFFSLFMLITPSFFLYVIAFSIFNGTIFFTLNITSYIAIFAAVFSFSTFLFTRKQIKTDRIFFLFVVLSFLIFCASLASEYFSTRYVLEGFFYAIFYLMILNVVDSPKIIDRLMIVLVFAATVQAIIGIVEYVSGIHFFEYIDIEAHGQGIAMDLSDIETGKLRANGSHGVNYFAALLASALPLAAGMAILFKKKVLPMIVFSACSILIMSGIILSSTRGAVLSIVGMFVFIIYKYRSRLSLAKLIIVFIPIILITGILFTYNPKYIAKYTTSVASYADRIKSMANIFNYSATYIDEDLTSKETAVAGRIFQYKAALELISSNPFLGLGPGNSPTFMAQYSPVPNFGEIHNMFLLLAFDSGIPSVIIYLIIIFLAWKNYSEAAKIFRARGNVRMESVAIILQCSLLSYLIIAQTQQLVFRLGLLLLYPLSSVIRQQLLDTVETTY